MPASRFVLLAALLFSSSAGAADARSRSGGVHAETEGCSCESGMDRYIAGGAAIVLGVGLAMVRRKREENLA